MSSIRFRTENFIHLSNTTFFNNEVTFIGEGYVSQGVSGLYTIGDVLPSGLSEEIWNELFTGFFHSSLWRPTETILGSHSYADVLGGGFPPPAEFIYGRPEREFDNRVDLLDPDTLLWAETATLVYRQESGEVLLDTSGVDSGYITGFLLRSDNDFLSEHYTPLSETQFLQADDAAIAFFADLIEPGRYNLGSFLEAGLSLEEFEEVFTVATFLSRAGFGGGSFDFAADGIAMKLVFQAVPEPASYFVFLITWGLLLLPVRSEKWCNHVRSRS